MIYNIEHFRLRYVGVCSALKVAAALLFFLDWVLVSWSPTKDAKEKPIGLAVGDIVSSIISLDRLSTLGYDRRSVQHMELIESGSGSGSPDSDYNSAADEDEDLERRNHDAREDDTTASGHNATYSSC